MSYHRLRWHVYNREVVQLDHRDNGSLLHLAGQDVAPDRGTDDLYSGSIGAGDDYPLKWPFRAIRLPHMRLLHAEQRGRQTTRGGRLVWAQALIGTCPRLTRPIVGVVTPVKGLAGAAAHASDLDPVSPN